MSIKVWVFSLRCSRNVHSFRVILKWSLFELKNNKKSYVIFAAQMKAGGRFESTQFEVLQHSWKLFNGIIHFEAVFEIAHRHSHAKCEWKGINSENRFTQWSQQFRIGNRNRHNWIESKSNNEWISCRSTIYLFQQLSFDVHQNVNGIKCKSWNRNQQKF